MEYTPNASFKKPGYNDPVDIADINGNFDIADTQLGAIQKKLGGVPSVKVSSSQPSGQSTNDIWYKTL